MKEYRHFFFILGKASSATHVHSVTRGKKIEIAVDKLYPFTATFQISFEKQVIKDYLK